MDAINWGIATVPTFFLVLFLTSYRLEPRRLINGWLFNFFLVTFLAALAFFILRSQNMLLIAVTGTLFIIFVLLIVVFFALHLLWLIWNAIVVWRKESHSLGNMLTLLIALALLALEILSSVVPRFLPGPIYNALGVFIFLSGFYILVTLYNFLTILIIYNLRWPNYHQDFLIVLGAGLLHGDQVSPLLAARINAGIKFFFKQVSKGRPAPVMIFSGGQGGDEAIPEGLAMQRYAIAHGVPVDHTLVEDQSKTTFENMKFSAALMQQHHSGPYKATFFTNNYHLFRAGIYARLAHTPANGIGAATSFYFLPNAVIREYLALVLMYKRRHAVVLIGITLISLLFLLAGW
ncbi:YdcF family protein [Lacticaseibacillus brantae]|uniref:DUF218 domain-containing protein n=1 Tax=Lacticaseibacillus brantae DSM 23927 TaxID=1423727 RepID=A0A0R2AX52_9LACO|nr:YdcF family protein [Lacticaseibacillus brantae]KRM71274.1 hypothetical protein FC34_GL001753 [Lacticaseibacillus brantae DSM 23927]